MTVNRVRRSLLGTGLLGAGLVVSGCASQSVRTEVVSQRILASDRVRFLDLALLPMLAAYDSQTQDALVRSGWFSGAFAREFASGFVGRMRQGGVSIVTIRSSWGPQQDIPLSSASPLVAASPTRFGMQLRPVTFEFEVTRKTNTPAGFARTHAIMVMAELFRRGDQQPIWVARQRIAPLIGDPTGAFGAGDGIVGALALSGLTAG